jgi:DNA-binding NarL/FixJ family response regulator
MSLLILVADDDLGTRLSVSDYLEMSGYTVIAAENGLQALELLEIYRPHLMVTDIMMPQMDGYEVVKQMRQRPEFRLLPVIFLTERASTEERIRGYQLGCDFYLPKPFDIQELGAMIRNLFERTSNSTLALSQLIQAEWQSRVAAQPVPKAELFREPINLVGNLNLVLTQREKEVLHLLTNGLSNTEIGHNLHLSPRTIEKHVSSLLRKTFTNNRAELVRFALENHLVK